MNKLPQIEQVVFDFDNTLFNTEKFKQKLYKMAKIHGYSHERARNIYKRSRTENERIIMSLSSFINVLKEDLQKDEIDFKSEKVSDMITDMKNNDGLLPYAAELLKYCKQQDLDTYVLSLGYKEWQEEKIEQSGIKSILDEENILYTDNIENGKQGILRDLFGKNFSGENTAFFNDKPDETGDILHDFKQLRAFVRFEERDDRYRQADFEQLKDRFDERIFWSEQLKVLLNKFKKLYEDKQ